TADLVDHARTVAVRDNARERDLARAALARLDVGGIDARGREPHAHLAGPGLRRRDLADAQYLRDGTIGVVVGGAHATRRMVAAPVGGRASFIRGDEGVAPVACRGVKSRIADRDPRTSYSGRPRRQS